MIEVQGLHKTFGPKTVLRGLDFRVDPGEIVALAGNNGAGKTTILRLLMGFLEANRGSIRVLGENPLGRRHLGRVGWMPERPNFPRRFTVERLVAFQAASFAGWDADRAAELLDRFALEPSARADRLSHGQRARLALTLALGHRPELLLLDDPTLGLDAAGRRLLMGELLGAAVDTGSGVLLSTHLLAEADGALDRLMVLRDGKIQLDEAAEPLRARCRKLHLPPDTPLPSDLGAIEGPDGALMMNFDAERWSSFQEQIPAARCAAAGLEDVYVAVAEDTTAGSAS